MRFSSPALSFPLLTVKDIVQSTAFTKLHRLLEQSRLEQLEMSGRIGVEIWNV